MNTNDGQSMWHEWNMYLILVNNSEEKRPLENVGRCGKIGLQLTWILKRRENWIGLIWFRIWTIGGLL
jgi:hypothetical protein